MNAANVGPITAESAVYGACRPGHLGAGVDDWTRILTDLGIETVVCLLSTGEAARWSLPGAYADAFETAHVPIRDRHLPDPAHLDRALAVIEQATADGDGVALHCNAGLGRTGVVGAAWLVRHRGYAPEHAVETVEAGPLRRAPREAVRADNATEAELFELLSDG